MQNAGNDPFRVSCPNVHNFVASQVFDPLVFLCCIVAL